MVWGCELRLALSNLLTVLSIGCYDGCTGDEHRAHTTTTRQMFFTLPDGKRFKAKQTKRGQYLHGVAVQYRLPCSDGSESEFWNLASQHLSADAAIAAGVKQVKTAPHLINCKLLKAA